MKKNNKLKVSIVMGSQSDWSIMKEAKDQLDQMRKLGVVVSANPYYVTALSDLYRARASSAYIILSITGAAKAIGLVIPELDGKLNGMATRVPTLNVSMLDFTFETEKSFSLNELIEIIRNAANGEYKGILSVCDLPLVSTDFNHNPSSSIFDSNHLYQIGNQTKILAWYDNSKRNLPWRVSKKSSKKLYYRLLSEFMLQQTQVKTVIPYFKKFTKRGTEHEYSIDHYKNKFYIITNWKAKNNRLMETPDKRTNMSNWKEVISHRNDVHLLGMEIFKNHLVLNERKDGLRGLRIIPVSYTHLTLPTNREV